MPIHIRPLLQCAFDHSCFLIASIYIHQFTWGEWLLGCTSLLFTVENQSSMYIKTNKELSTAKTRNYVQRKSKELFTINHADCLRQKRQGMFYSKHTRNFLQQTKRTICKKPGTIYSSKKQGTIYNKRQGLSSHILSRLSKALVSRLRVTSNWFISRFQMGHPMVFQSVAALGYRFLTYRLIRGF